MSRRWRQLSRRPARGPARTRGRCRRTGRSGSRTPARPAHPDHALGRVGGGRTGETRFQSDGVGAEQQHHVIGVRVGPGIKGGAGIEAVGCADHQNPGVRTHPEFAGQGRSPVAGSSPPVLSRADLIERARRRPATMTPETDPRVEARGRRARIRRHARTLAVRVRRRAGETPDA